jgi:histidinol-phosphatase (PHP family)
LDAAEKYKTLHRCRDRLSVPEQDPDKRHGEAELAEAQGDAKADGPEDPGHADADPEGDEQEEQLAGHAGRSLGGTPAPRRASPRLAHAAAATVPLARLVAVLTDYHLHLRPDEEGTTAERFFTAENVERYLAAATAAGVEELGVSEHVYRFRQALELWSHPLWESNARDDLDAYCEFVRATPLRLGIECDFVPGAEERTRTLLEARDFDYVVGSVHFIGDDAVDHSGWDIWEGSGDPDEVWRRYFEALAECAHSGLFDILAHPDLVKVWGGTRPLPERDLRFFYEPAVAAIVEAGVAVEVSTAGLRKPVAELYPARGFAEMCVEAGAPFALSSDAHLPEQVGFGYDRAVEFLEDLGVGEICVFEQRRRQLAPLPSRVG